MGNDKLYTPVAFVIFNRPDCVRKSFASIRNARPQKLFIIADGPRLNHPDDTRLCSECREIVEKIDWDCEVMRNYSDENLGCGKRPSTGFSWVFENVDRAIILEDDCVPSKSFFLFCQEMLERYKNDERIFSVSGMNFNLKSDNGADYYFTRINNTWGWATWSRVWREYDYEIKEFSKFKANNKLLPWMVVQKFADYWYQRFDEVFQGKITSAWDYQFTFLSFLHHGLHIYPQKNMVNYIGFNDMATHVSNISEDNIFARATMPADDIIFPLHHPTEVQADFRIDYLTMRYGFGVSPNAGMICEYLDPNIVHKIEQYPLLLIYGAGTVCRDVIILLGKAGVDRLNIVVSDTKGNEQYVMGNLVGDIRDYQERVDEAFILVAVTRKYQKEMVEYLKELGFKHFTCVV